MGTHGLSVSDTCDNYVGTTLMQSVFICEALQVDAAKCLKIAAYSKEFKHPKYYISFYFTKMASLPGGLKIFVRGRSDSQTPLRTESKSHGNLNHTIDGNEVKSFYEDIVGLNDEETSKTDHDDGSTHNDNGKVSCTSYDHDDGTSTNSLNTDHGKRCRRSSTKSRKKRKRKRRSSSPHCHQSFHGHITGEQKEPTCSFQHASSERNSRDVSDCNIRILRCQGNFLKAAQDGDVKLVKDFLSRGVDINCQDRFGWSALMCASHAGHMPVIQVLLEAGAHINYRDNMGRTAVKMAALAKQHEIFQFLVNYGTDDVGNAGTVSTPENITFYCKICKESICDISVEKHETSTVHLFNCKLKPKPTSYFIPEYNKGYQLLLRSGWDKERGLGPEGQGKKFPVRTVLKRDRKGLGQPTEKCAKVTHFQPGDTKAVCNAEVRQMRKSTVSKRAQGKKLTKEKAKERMFRLEFYGI